MQKEVEHRGLNFLITVHLQSKMERRPNGRVWHTINIQGMDGFSYNKQREVLDNRLPEVVKDMEAMAKQAIDKLKDGGKPATDERLLALGFKSIF